MTKRKTDKFAEEYLSMRTDAKVILDVRGIDECKSGALPNSINIPLNDLPHRFQELPKDKRIFIHCKAGGRAQKAYDHLMENGYTNLCCAIEGGYPELSETIKT